MITSYGETSGFSPVTSEELEKTNGGSIVAIGALVVGYGIATIAYTAGKNSK
jgi:hypothetical protein